MPAGKLARLFQLLVNYGPDLNCVQHAEAVLRYHPKEGFNSEIFQVQMNLLAGSLGVDAPTARPNRPSHSGNFVALASLLINQNWFKALTKPIE